MRAFGCKKLWTEKLSMDGAGESGGSCWLVIILLQNYNCTGLMPPSFLPANKRVIIPQTGAKAVHSLESNLGPCVVSISRQL